MDRDSIRSSKWPNSQRQRRQSISEGTPLMDPAERDDRSIRSRRSSVWTDVSVYSVAASPVALDHSSTGTERQTPFGEDTFQDDVKSERYVRSERPPSTSISSGYTYDVVSPLTTQSLNKSQTALKSGHVHAPSQSSQRSCSIPNSPNASFPSSESTLMEPDQRHRFPQGGGSRGLRAEVYYPRGVLTRAGSREHQDQWQMALGAILNVHELFDPEYGAALYEEALESPGSGVIITTTLDAGKKQRVILKGNEPLSRVGEQAMRLVLTDRCYELHIPEDVAAKIISRTLSRQCLYQAGINTKIETWIRPMKPLHPGRQKSIRRIIGEDLKAAGYDKTRTVAQGIKAVMGALYFDQGVAEVASFMKGWGLWILEPGKDTPK